MHIIRVVIAEDQAVLRRGLCATLNLDEGIEVIGDVADGAALLALCRLAPPDIAVVDIRMPVMDGIAATRALKAELPHVKVLILTTFDDAAYLQELLALGVDGYLLKTSEDMQLAVAVKSAYLGLSPLDHAVMAKLATLLAPDAQEGTALTSVEEKVAYLIAQGLDNKSIAQQVDLSYGRTRNIVSGIYRKLGVFDRKELADRLGVSP